MILWSKKMFLFLKLKLKIEIAVEFDSYILPLEFISYVHD